MVQHHSGSHAHRMAFEIQLADLALIPREIYHQPVPDRPARQPGARAAGDHRHPRLHGRLDQGAHLPRRARKRHRHRLDLVKRGVGGVELEGQIIKRNLAVRAGQRRLLLRRSHRTPETYRASARMTMRNLVNSQFSISSLPQEQSSQTP